MLHTAAAKIMELIFGIVILVAAIWVLFNLGTVFGWMVDIVNGAKAGVNQLTSMF